MNESGMHYNRMIDQAIETVSVYAGKMAQKIDAKFGEGYAAKNPVLLAAAINACALDMLTGGIVNKR